VIYLFHIISDEDQGFYRDLVIDGSDTFLDFHHALQENLGYDPSQLASFFVTNEMWEKQQEITLIDMMQEQDLSTATMEQATLEEYITDETQRMIYVFDFFSERAFFIELLEQSDQTSPRDTPFIGHSEGEAPPQVVLDLLMDDPDSALEDFDPEEGSDDLRLDDLDPDMFDTGMPEDF
jgi:hypothetical protein